ncbi:MAG: stress responsive protein [Actinobacteria bacterium HGW-Actinobacteria-10]|jgi:quinol monooxygenase YgiN|nr:MAG: stress responsive protein [Actinobacteria bacterium HGW-Actinobacteria-10]
MIKHIVFFNLAEEAEGRTAEQNAREIKRQLEALNGKFPGLVRLEVGIDFSKTDSSADIALYSEFADRAALDFYLRHPLHLDIAEYVAKLRTARYLVDYEV